MDLLTLSWNDVYALCLKLAERVIRDDYEIDTIIAISRGGLVPSRIFADILSINNIFIASARYYNGINERLEKPIINFDVKIKENRKNLLIIDDVVDTGNTMLAIIDLLDKANVKTLALYKKIGSRFEPDYYAEVSDKWIVFPWERCEISRLLEKRNYI